MTEWSALSQLTIRGFKSIRNLENFHLNSLNLLIGANGSGKSNFISFFQMLHEMMQKNLQMFIAENGGVNSFLFHGQKITKQIECELFFDIGAYFFTLEPAIDQKFLFNRETIHLNLSSHPSGITRSLDIPSSGYTESHLKSQKPGELLGTKEEIAKIIYSSIQNWKVYQFHDTSSTAGMRQPCSIHDNKYFRTDASNLAAYLYLLKKTKPQNYERIRDLIRLAAPFFDDFILEPDAFDPNRIRLEWRETGSDFPFQVYQLSDGTLRFISLTTLLNQPIPPSTIIIDEPELGLHPYAISLLSEMFKLASEKSQLIVSTQSVTLVNQFEPKNIIVVEREKGESVFKTVE